MQLILLLMRRKTIGLDLNGDNVQGRNVQKFDRAAFITEKIFTFAALDSKALY